MPFTRSGFEASGCVASKTSVSAYRGGQPRRPSGRGIGREWEHLGLFQKLVEAIIGGAEEAVDGSPELPLKEFDELRALCIASGLPCQPVRIDRPMVRPHKPRVLTFHPTPINLAALYLARRALLAGPRPPSQSDREALAVLRAIRGEIRRQGLSAAYDKAATQARGNPGIIVSGPLGS